MKTVFHILTILFGIVLVVSILVAKEKQKNSSPTFYNDPERRKRSIPLEERIMNKVQFGSSIAFFVAVIVSTLV